MRVSKTMRIGLLVAILAVHTLVTVLGVIDVGYLGLFQLGLRDWAARQVFLDLSIALLLMTTWLVPDARKHGISPWPYVIAMLPLGSFGPLGYLIHREWSRGRVREPARAASTGAARA